MTPSSEQLDSPVRRIKKADPVTKGDYQKIMASVTKRDIKVICILTSHWPMSFFYDVQSECKLKKTEVDKAKYINWFVKNTKTKEI